jgi:dTDP-4-dehydrorhamnose reductase
MNILITGTNGYVGGSLYKYLKLQHQVTALTRKEVDLTNSNAVNNYFKDRYYDIVLHCAISGGHRLKEDGISVLDDNLKMYYNIESNKNNFGKFINFGSGAEIYARNKPYGLSKSIINESIKEKGGFYNIRIYAVFDENELDTRFIKTCILNYLQNKEIVIHANKHMDFFYMKDLLNVVDYYISENPPFKEFNCTYGKPNTLKDIADFVNSLGRHKVPITIQNEGLDKDYVSLVTQHLYDLNYIGLEEGIIQTYIKLKNEKD